MTQNRSTHHYSTQYKHTDSQARKKEKNASEPVKSREITTVTEHWGLVLKFSDASVDES